MTFYHSIKAPRRMRSFASIKRPQLTIMMMMIFLVSAVIPTTYSQGICDTTPTTWDDLITAIDVNYGIVFLCPFTITGDACPTRTQGYPVKNGEVTLLCEPSYSGTERIGCVIDCPGTHFDVYQSGSLFLDGMTLRGATTSALKLRRFGTIMVYNSIFETNFNDDGNGGAISAKQGSKMTIMYTRFQNNRGLNGGGVYHLGRAYVKGSLFVNNKASEGGGGAIYAGSEAHGTIIENEFANNSAGFFGPAVFDGSGVGILQFLNGGCGNLFSNGASAGCDGITFIQNGVQSCNDFLLECTIPTPLPIAMSDSTPPSP